MQEMQETWIQSLGQEDPLEEEMATQSSILAWEIPWTEEPGRLHSMGSQRVRHDWTHTRTCTENRKDALDKRCRWLLWLKKPAGNCVPCWEGEENATGRVYHSLNVYVCFLSYKITTSLSRTPPYMSIVWRNWFFSFTTGFKIVQASLVYQVVKNPPAMREIWVQSLGWEDPLEKGKVRVLGPEGPLEKG